MKYSLLLVLTSLVITGSVSAQKRKRQNPFDTTLARKHELSVSLGFSSGPIMLNAGGYGNGPTFSLEYARVYKTNHFLRTGFRFTLNAHQTSQQNSVYLPSDPSTMPPPPPNGPVDPDNVPILKTNGSDDTHNIYAGAFVGYEYGLGHKRFRFTFGADLQFGYLSREMYSEENQYIQTRSVNAQTGLYQYDIQYLQSGSIDGRSSNLFVALSPRIGMRVDISKRIALALTFAPQIGFTQQVHYSEVIMDTRPSYYYHPKSAWFDSPGGELRLIFKLGKS